MVLPFYHSGMGDVLPRKKRIPRPGNTVVVQVGDPVDLAQLATKCKSDTVEGQKCAWKEITAVIEESLRELESKTRPRNRNQLAEQH
jgi:monolysocardiolipin acyltransferase